MAFCTNCGKEVLETNRFCIYCGTTLQERSEEAAKPKTSKKKMLIPIIAVAAVLVIAAIIMIVSNPFVTETQNEITNPFEKLYIGQMRESVHDIFGTPDRAEYEEPGEEYSWNIDDYKNVKMFGKTGELSVWYDSENLVSHAFFDCGYTGADTPSGKERDEVRECADAIIAYYTEKYGKPSNGYFMYEWDLPDGSSFGMDVNMSPELSIDYAIEILWN